MKTLIVLIGYATVSGFIGLIVCGLLLWKKQQRGALIGAFIFFGGPALAYAVLYVKDTLRVHEFEAAQKEVQELCAKYGGDKIYKTVENVEGVFQMKARPKPYTQWKDQYGMVDPWGFSQGDSDDPLSVTFDGNGYLFIEQQPEFGQSNGPPYRRKFLYKTNEKIGELNPLAQADVRNEFVWKAKQITVQKLRSHYGYITEDLTTPEMRKKWIGAGKTKIIDLQTQDVLAERTGYFLAVGAPNQVAWAPAIACTQSSLSQLLLKVLKPITVSIQARDQYDSLGAE